MHLRTSIALAVAALLATMVVMFHPASQLESVRRQLGFDSKRALPPTRIEDDGGVYKFAKTQLGTEEPVGWDPCRPIRYQVNPADAPEDGDELIVRAVERISDATGLKFKSEGTTTRRPFTEQFVPIGTDRPVVIGWATEAEFPTLAGDSAGVGGAASEEGTLSGRYYVTGGVALDTDLFTTALVATEARTMEAIVLHELAHVVGLAHVDEPTELMFASTSELTDFGPGDREGLARLGSLPCE